MTTKLETSFYRILTSSEAIQHLLCPVFTHSLMQTTMLPFQLWQLQHAVTTYEIDSPPTKTLMLSVLLKMGTLRVILICVPPSVLPFLGNTLRMSVQWKIVSEVVQLAHIIWHMVSTCLPYFCLSPFLLPDILPVICTTWCVLSFRHIYGMTLQHTYST